jgi:hypothetical protein
LKKFIAESILDAAHRTANKLGFDDGENAFWQCNLFSNAIIQVAQNHDIFRFELVVVEAEWQTPSGDCDVGARHKHCLLKFDDVFIDFTIRQINSDAKYPFISKKLPRYYEFYDLMSFDDTLAGNSDLSRYVEEIEEELKSPSKISGTFKIRK